jgi:hypothetical protein
MVTCVYMYYFLQQYSGAIRLYFIIFVSGMVRQIHGENIYNRFDLKNDH